MRSNQNLRSLWLKEGQAAIKYIKKNHNYTSLSWTWTPSINGQLRISRSLFLDASDTFFIRIWVSVIETKLSGQSSNYKGGKPLATLLAFTLEPPTEVDQHRHPKRRTPPMPPWKKFFFLSSCKQLYGFYIHPASQIHCSLLGLTPSKLAQIVVLQSLRRAERKPKLY